jgi:hypothetical protein
MSTHLVPAAPVGMRVTPSTDHWIIAIMALFCVGALIYGVVHLRQSGRPVVLLLWLSGGAMMIFEPLVDTVGGCWFPANAERAFTLWGRPMPIWLCLAYFFYFGIGVSVGWVLMKRGMTPKQLWVFFVVAMLGDFAFENILLIWDPYTYYGAQPLWLSTGFALWWAPVNAMIVMAASAVICRFDAYFTGARTLVIVPAVVSISAAVNAVTGWPSWMSINSGFGDVPRTLSGLATFALAAWLMSLVVKAVAVPARAEAQSRALAAA